MIDLNELQADSNGMVNLMPSAPAPAQPAPGDMAAALKQLDDSLLSMRDEMDRGVLCNLFAKKYNMIFLGFSVTDQSPLFK